MLSRFCFFIMLFCFFVCTPFAWPTGRAPDSSDVTVPARWLMAQQYSRPALSSFGGIKVHNTVSAIGASGKQYYRVSPYIADLGVLGLLHTHVPGRIETAGRWIIWYLAHLDARSAPDGVPYEQFYFAEGSGETACVKPGDHFLCHYNDATDSAAATFFAVCRAWVQSGGSAALLTEPDNRVKLKKLAHVLLALQQPDGLFWAKADYQVKYLEDNCEVYDGLCALSWLEQRVFKNSAKGKEYEASSLRVRQGIEKELFDAHTGLYAVAKFENGAVPAPNTAVWYPDMQAQAWPILFGVETADGPGSRAFVAALDRFWNGKRGPDWAASPERINNGWINADVAYAALLAGDRKKAALYLKTIVRSKFPGSHDSTGFSWPFTDADAGWLLSMLTYTGRH